MNLRHFKISEFDCPCCHKVLMQERFLKMLDEARGRAMIPMKINSGFRCEKHNLEIPGSASNSPHLRGWAADISCTNSRDRMYIVRALLLAGFDRIGIRKDFIHVDCDPSLKVNLLWLYE